MQEIGGPDFPYPTYPAFEGTVYVAPLGRYLALLEHLASP
jgi:hypothetical protein